MDIWLSILFNINIYIYRERFRENTLLLLKTIKLNHRQYIHAVLYIFICNCQRMSRCGGGSNLLNLFSMLVTSSICSMIESHAGKLNRTKARTASINHQTRSMFLTARKIHIYCLFQSI